MGKKIHWFCFSYIGKEIEGGKDANACAYTGYKKKYVTKSMIDKNKVNAGLSSGVLIACTHLGYMTKDDFLSE